MNIELKPIAESKIRQLGGDVCGVLVRTDGGVMAVSEHGRCTRLDAGVMGPVEGAQDGEWLIQMRGEYLKTRGVWERPDHRGYTNDINEAGRYSEEEAKEAERMMPDKCKAVRLPTASAQAGQGAEAVYQLKSKLGGGWDDVGRQEYENAHETYARRIVYTQPQPAGPEGWKLVPVAPTKAMRDAAQDAFERVAMITYQGIYRAMLAAAPQPPKEGSGNE